MGKKIRTILVMMIILLPVSVADGVPAYASETIASGTCGDTVNWLLDEDGLLTVSGTGKMDYYLSPYTVPWYAYRKSITKVEFGENVTNIGSFSFYGCSSLTDIVLPDQLTAIESYALAHCTSLEEITLPDQLASLGGYSFCGCSSLTGIILPDALDRINDYTFYGCTKLTGITIPESIKSLGDYAFARCSSLKNIVIPDSVTGIGDYGFAWCSGLAGLTISENTPEIGNNVFYGCSESLTIQYSGGSGTILPEELSAVTGAETSNSGGQNYSVWASTVKSYLVANEDGTMTRVEYTGSYITVEQYAADGRLSDRGWLEMELPLFGGFYAGTEYNFLVFGQTNHGEDDNTEVIRIVKYSKDWQRLGEAGLYGANTTVPFDAGSLRMTQCGDMLYVRTSHEMYKSEDNNNHQANLTFCVQISSMTITDQSSEISYSGTGYVSHSFNQFIIVNGSELVTVDHGDANPRAVVLMKYAGTAGGEKFTGSCSSVNVLNIMGEKGANDTGVSVGGLEYSDTSYLVVGNSVAQDTTYHSGGVRNIFVSSTPVNDFTADATDIHWITQYSGSEKVSTPQLVKISGSRFLLMWTVDGVLNYVFLNAAGEVDGEIYSSATGALSDCQPVLSGGKVVWYTTMENEPLYCSIDPDSPEKVNILNLTHTVKFCSLGGNMDTDSMTVKYGNAYGTLPKPVKDNCIFLGWFTSVDGGSQVTEDTIVTATGNEKLYARWLEKEACGDNLTWNIEDGVLTVSGTGDMYDWPYLSNTPWYSCRNLFDEVVIENGVTSIGKSAFAQLGELTKATVAGSVAKLGGYAFYGCNSLSNIVLPDSVTNIGSAAFKNCTGLNSIVISESVKSLPSEMFAGCESLSSITLPDGITAIESCAFQNCSSLGSILIPEGVTSLGWYVFAECTALEEITIPYTVTTIDDTTFSGHSGILVIAGYKDTMAEEYAGKNHISFKELSYEYTGACGDNLTWSLRDGILTICGEGAMEDGEKGTDSPWYSYRTLIKRAVVENGVTGIGANAFYNARSLDSIELPDSVMRIGEHAFLGCSSLRSLVIPEAVTEIPYGMMEDCSSLNTIEFSGKVTDIGGFAFYGCKSLNSIELPDSVTDIGGYAFYRCSSLNSIELPDSVTDIGGYAFYGCSSLSSFAIPEGVASIERSTFDGCTALLEITIPMSVISIDNTAFSGHSESLVIYGYKGSRAETYAQNNSIAFQALSYEYTGRCGESLTWILRDGELTISGEGQMEDKTQSDEAWYSYGSLIEEVVFEDGVTGIGEYAFYGCRKIEKVTMADSVSVIGTCAFQGCISLNSIQFSGALSVINSYAFQGCSSLGGITLPDSVISIGLAAFDACISLNSLAIPEGITRIPSDMLAGCSSLSSVVLPDSITSIEEHAFGGCSSLSSMIIPDKVTVIGDFAFRDCVSLSSLVIPDSVTKLGSYTFGGCTGLKEITIPASVQSIADTTFSECDDDLEIYGYEGSYAETFAESKGITFVALSFACTGTCGENLRWSLTNGILTVSGAGDMTDWTEGGAPWYSCESRIEEVVIGDGVTGIGTYAFAGCSNVAKVTMPDRVSAIGEYAFSNCSSLTDIGLSGGLTEIGSAAFKNCGNLESIQLPDSVTEISSSLFADCVHLRNVKLSERVTMIGESAFKNCIRLSSIELPEGMTSIKANAFYKCLDLSKIMIPSTVTLIENTAFLECRAGLIIYGYKNTEAEDYAENNSITFIVLSGDAGVDGENLVWSLKNGILTVSGKGDMADWPAFQTPWYSCQDLIAEVVIEDDVTSIGENAFYGCSNIKKVTMADSISVMGAYAFCDCSSLSGIKLSEGITSIEAHTFDNCSSLSGIELPEGVTGIEAYAFCDCSSLSGIKLPEGITSIETHAFDNCSSLSGIELPEGVTSIKAFAFYNCSSLSGIELPVGVGSIGNYAFSGCTDLTGITIPFTVDSISDNAFYGCSDKLVIQCDKNTVAEEYANNKKIRVDAVSYIYTGTCGENLTWSLADGILTVTGAGKMADGTSDCGAEWTSYRNAIVQVVAEEGISYIGAYAFSDCSRLKGAELPDSLTELGMYAFRRCAGLSSIEFPANLVHIGNGAFSDCSSLTDITIPGSVAAIGESAFNNCTGLKEITFEGDKPSVERYTFYGVKGNGYYPAGYPSWEGIIERLGQGTFTWSEYYQASGTCGENLSWTLDSAGTLTISGSGQMTSYESQGDVPWYDYIDQICSVSIGEEVTGIGAYGFAGCSSLTEIVIPSGVTVIGDSAFSGCTSLSEITFEGSRPFIGSGVFDGVNADVYYPFGDDSWGNPNESDVGGNLTWYDHVHIAVEDAAVAATCTKPGLTAGSHCSVCDVVLEEQKEIEPLGHREIKDAAVAATCIKAGVTAGSHCSVCGEVLEAQEEIEPLGHREVKDAAAAATCTKAGVTAGSHCSVCGEVLEAQKEIEPLGHREVTDAGIAATCTKAGITAESHCSVCGEVLEAQKEIKPLGHHEVTDAGMDATCTEPGITAGSHCSVCGEVLEVQEKIEPLGHHEVKDAKIESTCTEPGKTAGSHCSICGEVFEAQKEIEPLGHRVVKDAAVAATCTQAGVTAGSHCSVCGEVLEGQQKLAALGHSWDEGVITKEATCTEAGEIRHTCSVCNETRTEEIEILRHSWDEGVITKESTCIENGTVIYTCIVCGEAQTKDLEMSPHKLIHYEEEPAACTTSGTVEHWSCLVCGKNFSDAEGNMEISSLTEEATGHNYEHGVCTACGLPDPDAASEGGGSGEELGEKPGGNSGADAGTHPDGGSEGSACSHQWGEWVTKSKATVFAAEQQEHVCSVCGALETREYGSAKIPYITLPANSLKMQMKQTTTKFRVIGMEEGDYVVSVKSSNVKILKVSNIKAAGTFKLKAQKKKGTAKLTITLASGLTKTVKVKVQKAKIKTTKLAVESKTILLKEGKTMALDPVITPVTSQQKLTWKSSDKRVVTVNSKGVLTAKKEGTAKITIISGKKKIGITVKVTK